MVCLLFFYPINMRIAAVHLKNGGDLEYALVRFNTIKEYLNWYSVFKDKVVDIHWYDGYNGVDGFNQSNK